MISNTNIAFVTWDSPQTNYLQNLFLPIFNGLKNKYGYNFIIIQFSWANSEVIDLRKQAVENLGFTYYNLQVSLKPNAFIGKFISIFNHRNTINSILKKHQIDILMPRSIMPALVSLFIKNSKIKICYDADGLPILERLESLVYKKNDLSTIIFKSIESKRVKTADRIITRSEFASQYLSSNYQVNKEKFNVVVNGKDSKTYYFDEILRDKYRNKLDCTDKTILFIYIGSLGVKYRLQDMIDFFVRFNKINSNSKFIILSPDSTSVNTNIKGVLKFEAPANEVVGFLNAADIGLGFITETSSMRAAAAIKYSEYALCGLPSLISDVGDVLIHAKSLPYLKHYKSKDFFNDYFDFINQSLKMNRNENVILAQNFFSLNQAIKSYHSALCNI